jgi:hypothetical protein
MVVRLEEVAVVVCECRRCCRGLCVVVTTHVALTTRATTLEDTWWFSQMLSMFSTDFFFSQLVWVCVVL